MYFVYKSGGLYAKIRELFEGWRET